jgi:hypothetical protein
VNSSTDFTYFFIAAAIPGIGLLAGGRGRKFIGTTVAGFALTVVGLSTFLFDWAVNVRYMLHGVFYSPDDATIFGALLAIAGLGLILLSTWHLKATPATARGYLWSGGIVLVFAFIDGVLLSNHAFWGEPACSYPLFETAPTVNECRYWQDKVAQVQSIGALIGVTLLGAGFYSFGLARRAEATRRA